MQKLEVFRFLQWPTFFAVINKPTTGTTDAKEVVFYKINLQKEHYLMLKKSTEPLPQLFYCKPFLAVGTQPLSSIFSAGRV